MTGVTPEHVSYVCTRITCQGRPVDSLTPKCSRLCPGRWTLMCSRTRWTHSRARVELARTALLLCMLKSHQAFKHRTTFTKRDSCYHKTGDVPVSATGAARRSWAHPCLRVPLPTALAASSITSTENHLAMLSLRCGCLWSPPHPPIHPLFLKLPPRQRGD